MTSDPSVTQWIDQLKAGDPGAAQQLWERYFQGLVNLARKRLQSVRRVAQDEEDVALSAFDSFCRRAQQGRFPRLDDRDDLWQLLVVITARKAADLIEYENADKRWPPALLASAGAGRAMAQIVDDEPTPEFAAEVAEQCQRLLDCLPEEQLRTIAVRKLEGYTNAEIAAELGCAPPTVERRLARIRSEWRHELSR